MDLGLVYYRYLAPGRPMVEIDFGRFGPRFMGMAIAVEQQRTGAPGTHRRPPCADCCAGTDRRDGPAEAGRVVIAQQKQSDPARLLLDAVSHRGAQCPYEASADSCLQARHNYCFA